MKIQKFALGKGVNGPKSCQRGPESVENNLNTS